MELDDIDINIIELIQKEGTKSLSKIASELKIGVSTVYRRLQKLEFEGLIRYAIILNPIKMGFNIIGVVELKINTKIENDIIEKLKLIESITEIFKITGEFQIMIKIRSNNISNLNNILERIKLIEGIYELHSFIVLDIIKESYELPLKEVIYK